jgi:signal transduction histidine kinase
VSDLPKGLGGAVEPLDRDSSIRHDINNLLMGLMGYVDLLLNTEGLPEDARTQAEAIARQADRIRERLADLNKEKR